MSSSDFEIVKKPLTKTRCLTQSSEARWRGRKQSLYLLFIKVHLGRSLVTPRVRSKICQSPL